MPEADDMLIQVHAAWDGWRSAEVRSSDLREVHWLQPNGAPRPLVHAYVSCTDLLTGEIPHDCGSSSPPHRLRVCILKKHTIPGVYAQLVCRAGESRTRFATESRWTAQGRHETAGTGTAADADT